MYLQTEEIRKSRPTSDWKQANQSIHSSNYHRDNYSWRRFYFTETDFIHDFTTIPLIFARAVRRIDGITGMSRGISEGKQNKKLPIRIKAVEFVYSLQKKNDDLIVIQNERFEFRQVLTLDAHANSYQHPGARGVVGPPPPPEFLICCSISKRLWSCLQDEGIFYGWWRCWGPVSSPTMVTTLTAILDFTKN